MTKREFKKLCKENNYRYKLDECRDPISPTRRRSHPDHLYWTGTKFIGVHVGRKTERKYNNIKNKLLALGCDPIQDCTTEGNFFVHKDDITPVAKLLGVERHKLSEAKRRELSERMRAMWKSGKMGRGKR
jgi:hypothetical protein